MNFKQRIGEVEQLHNLAIDIESANRLASLYMGLAEKANHDKVLSEDFLRIAKSHEYSREKYAHQFKQLAKELYESI